jgi:hypothetical protein
MNKSKQYEQTVKKIQLTEQKADYLMPFQPDNPAQKGKPGYVDPHKSYPMDNEMIHSLADVASIGALFIPGIGLLLSTGIELANAGLYASEGDTKEAGLRTVFALLPGLPNLFNRIPGLKGMTKKGIDALIKAVETKKATPAQKAILNKIGLNKDFIKQEIESLIKIKAKTDAAKIAASTLSPAKKTLLQKVGQGTVKASKLGTEITAVNTGYQAVEAGYNKAYNYMMPTYEELVAKQQQENQAYLDKLLRNK